MIPRRLRTIAQIPEARRLHVLAEGVTLLSDSVKTLEKDAVELAALRRHQSAAVLRCFSEEEAAKVLIVLDIARAGWRDHKAVSACMSNFYSHLARGLYTQAYGGSPADLAEVRRYVDTWRQEFYLDGPMDVDWIFGNEVITSREERLYVDYVEEEDGNHRWVGPAERALLFDEPFTSPNPTSVVVQLIDAMDRIGLLTESGLEAIHRVWATATVPDSMQWMDLRPYNLAVIDQLVAAGLDLTTDTHKEAAKYVLEHWIFPLSSLDLSMVRVALTDLKEQRERWLARELGWENHFEV